MQAEQLQIVGGPVRCRTSPREDATTAISTLTGLRENNELPVGLSRFAAVEEPFGSSWGGCRCGRRPVSAWMAERASARGPGYSAEGVRALVCYTFTEPAVIVATTMTVNTASRWAIRSR